MRKEYPIVILFALFASLPICASIDTNLFIFPKYDYLGTPLFDVLDQTLGKGSSLVFTTEDTMKSNFKELVSDSDYDCYVYYDRGVQISGPTGGGFNGDYFDRAQKNLSGVIKGVIIPIFTETNTRSVIASNNIFEAYWDKVKEECGFEILFIAETKLLSTLVRLEGYKTGRYKIALIGKLDRGTYITSQIKYHKKNQKKIPEDFIGACDLRNPNLKHPKDLLELLRHIEDRKKLVLFNGTEESIEAFATFFDYESRKSEIK